MNEMPQTYFTVFSLYCNLQTFAETNRFLLTNAKFLRDFAFKLLLSLNFFGDRSCGIGVKYLSQVRVVSSGDNKVQRVIYTFIRRLICMI